LRIMAILLGSLVLGGCQGEQPNSGQLAGRWALTGPFHNTFEISAAAPGCGPVVQEEGHLDFPIEITPKGGDRATIHQEGPGCTIEVGATDTGYLAEDTECVLDPEGGFKVLGVTRSFYRSLVIDSMTLQWIYDLEMTWPSTRLSDGNAKVCGHGQASLTRLSR
jgi:hypothetical protein